MRLFVNVPIGRECDNRSSSEPHADFHVREQSEIPTALRIHIDDKRGDIDEALKDGTPNGVIKSLQRAHDFLSDQYTRPPPSPAVLPRQVSCGRTGFGQRSRPRIECPPPANWTAHQQRNPRTSPPLPGRQKSRLHMACQRAPAARRAVREDFGAAQQASGGDTSSVTRWPSNACTIVCIGDATAGTSGLAIVTSTATAPTCAVQACVRDASAFSSACCRRPHASARDETQLNWTATSRSSWRQAVTLPARSASSLLSGRC